MSNKKFYEDSTFWLGVLSYYVLCWIFTYYPAFIYGLFMCQQIEPEFSDIPELWGFIWMLVAYGVIQFMLLTQKYTAVVIVYLITLWPFLKILKHCYDYIGDHDTFPLPPVDWFPW